MYTYMIKNIIQTIFSVFMNVIQLRIDKESRFICYIYISIPFYTILKFIYLLSQKVVKRFTCSSFYKHSNALV